MATTMTDRRDALARRLQDQALRTLARSKTSSSVQHVQLLEDVARQWEWAKARIASGEWDDWLTNASVGDDATVIVMCRRRRRSAVVSCAEWWLDVDDNNAPYGTTLEHWYTTAMTADEFLRWRQQSPPPLILCVLQIRAAAAAIDCDQVAYCQVETNGGGNKQEITAFYV